MFGQVSRCITSNFYSDQFTYSEVKGVSIIMSEVWKNEGVRGFYKGFGTVVVGAIPSRIVYMSTLEIVRKYVFLEI